MTRRFVTRTAVDAALERGETTLDVSGVVTVTDEAAARARERGLTFVRDGVVVAGRASPGSAETPGAPHEQPVVAGPAAPAVDRSAVRRAVVAVLGTAPPELDAALDRVMREQQRGG